MQNTNKRKALYIMLGAALMLFSLLPWLALITDSLAFNHVNMLQIVVSWRGVFQGSFSSGLGDPIGRVRFAFFLTLIASAIMVAIGMLLVLKAFRPKAFDRNIFWIVITVTLITIYLTSATIYLATIRAGFAAYGHILLNFLLIGLLLIILFSKFIIKKKRSK